MSSDAGTKYGRCRFLLESEPPRGQGTRDKGRAKQAKRGQKLEMSPKHKQTIIIIIIISWLASTRTAVDTAS